MESNRKELDSFTKKVTVGILAFMGVAGLTVLYFLFELAQWIGRQGC